MLRACRARLILTTVALKGLRVRFGVQDFRRIGFADGTLVPYRIWVVIGTDRPLWLCLLSV